MIWMWFILCSGRSTQSVLQVHSLYCNLLILFCSILLLAPVAVTVVVPLLAFWCGYALAAPNLPSACHRLYTSTHSVLQSAYSVLHHLVACTSCSYCRCATACFLMRLCSFSDVRHSDFSRLRFMSNAAWGVLLCPVRHDSQSGYSAPLCHGLGPSRPFNVHAQDDCALQTVFNRPRW